MSKRKKGAVRRGHGVMCKICGRNCGKGGALKKHVEGAHSPVTYKAYKLCFYSEAKTVLADAWDDSVTTHGGNVVVTHIFVRRFINPAGSKRVTRSERLQNP